MRFRVWLVAIGVVAVAGVLTEWQAGWTQAPLEGDLFAPAQESNNSDPFGHSDIPGEKGERVRVERREIQAGPWKQKFEFKTKPDSMNEIQAAAKEMHDAKDGEARAESREKLTALLNKYFDEDMKRREDELKNVEARVKKLRSLLEKRQEKREEILDLQMKVLANEAEGLGFFSDVMMAAPLGAPWIIKGGEGFDPAGGTVIVGPPQPGAPGVLQVGGGSGGITISDGVLTPPTPPRPAPPVKVKAVPKLPRAVRPAKPTRTSSSKSRSGSWSDESESSIDADTAADEADEADAAPPADEAPVEETPVER